MSRYQRYRAAVAAFQDADNAWADGYAAICPSGVWPGDFRYTDAAKGEAGSALRALYDSRSASIQKWRKEEAAFKACLTRPMPRLVRALRASGHSETEALSAIHARRVGDDFAAAESVCHVGGAGAAVRHAIRCWRMGLPASRLKRLRAVADASEAAFDAACRPHYCDGRWGAYRAIECGQVVPGPVTDAMDDYLAATHAFYAARDGDKGFLGSRGL